jgi:enterochelin esterase-like enzyme
VIRTLLEPARPGRLAPQRMLLLPPAYTGPEDFVRAGFVDAVRERGLALDLVLIELRLGSVTDRSIVPLVRTELILPAREGGCRALWLGGISLGGYVALLCAERFAGDLDGLCLFAPYLGSHLVTSEIARAGGVGGWQPGEVGHDDEERRVWCFIKTRRERALPMHLGLGADDRFGARHRLMAAALEPSSVDVVSGGHEWPVWRTLWERFLDARFAHPAR